MIQGFDKIEKDFRSYNLEQNFTEEEFDNFRKNTVVALTAGGLGQRTSDIDKMQGINKNAYTFSNGKSIVEMAIELFKNSGYTHFVALVFHKAESIVEQLKEGTDLGVSIKYSYDPGHPVGRGGAILNALNNNIIGRNENLIIYNPSDLILNYKGDFPNDIVKAHLSNTKKGIIATMVATPGFEAQCSCLRLDNSVVTDLEFHPIVPIPSHMGASVVSPAMYEYLDKNIDLSQKCDFEKVIFPILAKEEKLGATEIPQNCWYPVKDSKTLEKAEEALKSSF